MFKWSKMAGPGTIWYMMFVMFACDAPFYLTIAVDCCCVFFFVYKKTKRKSHWQPTNHNKKKKRWTETLSLRFKKNWKHIYMHICRCTSVYIVLRLGVEPVIIGIPSQISLWTVLLSILCCFLHIIFSIPLEHLFKSTNEPIKRLMRGIATEMRGRARQRAKKGYQVRFLVFAVLLIVSWPVHFICIGVKKLDMLYIAIWSTIPFSYRIEC